jgi:hypothetical protein
MPLSSLVRRKVVEERGGVGMEECRLYYLLRMMVRVSTGASISEKNGNRRVENGRNLAPLAFAEG